MAVVIYMVNIAV